MTVKKIGKKDFHNANRLNGNGADYTATYGVFEAGELVGKAHKCGGGWDAYRLDSGKRINPFTTATLSALKELLAKI